SQNHYGPRPQRGHEPPFWSTADVMKRMSTGTQIWTIGEAAGTRSCRCELCSRLFSTGLRMWYRWWSAHRPNILFALATLMWPAEASAQVTCRANNDLSLALGLLSGISHQGIAP